jgi:hypothetical protein
MSPGAVPLARAERNHSSRPSTSKASNMTLGCASPSGTPLSIVRAGAALATVRHTADVAAGIVSRSSLESCLRFTSVTADGRPSSSFSFDGLPRFGFSRHTERSGPQMEKAPRLAGLASMRRRGLEPPPRKPGPGPQPDSGGFLSIHTALDRHVPSAGEDDLDVEDDADVPKSVLTSQPKRAWSRLGDLPDRRRVSSVTAAIR